MFQSRSLWLWLVTNDGLLADANDLALQHVASDRDDLVWRPLWEGPWFEGDPALQAELRRALDLAANGEPFRLVADAFTTTGPRPLDLTLRPIGSGGASVGLLLLEGRDLSHEHRAVREHRTLLGALPLGVVRHDQDGRALDANDAARSLLHLPDEPTPSDLPGRACIDAEGRPLTSEGWPARIALRRGESVRDAIVGVPSPDGTRWLQVDAIPLRDRPDAAPHGALALLRDVTELRRQHRLIEHHTHLDPLTGLPNRRAFLAELERTIAAGEPVAVLLADLDEFRDANARFGHRVGDEVLRWVARRLERAVRPDDLPARLGADEFALLLRHVENEEALAGVAERVQELVVGTPRLAGVEVQIRASLGLAAHRGDRKAEQVLHDAGVALAGAKASAGPGWAIFDLDTVRRQAHEATFEAELGRAAELDQLEVHYQPLVNAKDHSVVGAEALMRWRHPVHGLIPPGEFIPLAERNGTIVQMEAWLQRAALAQLRKWNRHDPDFHLSFNLSARQLERHDVLAEFATALDESGANPDNVFAEVTETFAMQHPREAARVLNGLAELGLTLAIDDFGTGYSNLGQLQHLPFQVVKIDRSFLEDVPDNPRNFALVRTIVAMGQSLDLQVIAEGVETRTQADFLYWEGASWLQGFHFGRPMPAATFSQVALSGAVPFSEP